MNMGLMMQRARINHRPHIGPGTTWIDAYLASSGSPVFAFEFNSNLLDSSGNGYNASLSGTGLTYTSDDPAPSGGYCSNTTGAQYATLPSAANIAGNNAMTILGVVKVPSSGFGNNILWMGGQDSSTPSRHWAASMTFGGSATAPSIWVDSARDTYSVPLPVAFIDQWMTVINEYVPGRGWLIYAAKQGDTAFTVLGTPNAWAMDIHLASTNWLFQWNGIRRFIGKCAFVGMKAGTLTTADKNRFLIP